MKHNKIRFPEIKLKRWIRLDQKGQDKLLEDTLDVIRELGFPYHVLTMSDKRKHFRKTYKVDPDSLIDREKILQHKAGIKLASSYHPHMWSVPCAGKTTSVKLFNDQERLGKAIEKIFSLGIDFNRSTFRDVLRYYSGVQCVSNFRPTAAQAIYDLYAGDGVVWDMCAGYGGRLLGAMTSKRVKTYYGTEPCTATFNGLVEMKKDYQENFIDCLPAEYSKTIFDNGVKPVLLKDKRIELIKMGSEDFIPPEKVDLIFTSPPYWDTEKYSEEPTQSYVKYPTYSDWLNGYLGQSLENAMSALKPGGLIMINIADVKKRASTLERDLIDLARRKGLALRLKYKMKMSAILGAGNGTEKNEPIYGFRIEN